MQLKLILSASIMLASCSILHAQDMIYKEDGSTLTTLVKAVDDDEITYKKFDNPNGPDYYISKNDIAKIKYQNGSVVEFDHSSRQDRSFRRPGPPPLPPMKYKLDPNILSFAPLQLADNGVGLGISYERSLDPKGIVAFYVPVYIAFHTVNETNYIGTSSTDMSTMYYIDPGIKIYPTGNHSVVKYAVGASLLLASGKSNYDDYIYGGYNTLETHTMFGFLINNSLNINPSKHLYLGLELGLGATYLNTYDSRVTSTEPLVQFAFRIGYRF